MTTRRGQHGAGSVDGAASGFTLVELLVALLVGVLIAGATTTALSSFLRAKERAAARQQASLRADSAASRIARDASRVVRDADLLRTRVLLTDGRVGDADSDQLLLFVRSMDPVRGLSGVPEGGEAEVQFRLAPAEGRAGAFELWRRADPVPDDYPDAGGVAEPIVDGLAGVSMRASDGSVWVESWDSDASGYPMGLEITVMAVADDGRTTAASRRVVAFDRVPLPPIEDEATDDPASTPTTPTNTGSTGNTGSGGGTPVVVPPPRGGGGSGGGGQGGGGSRGGNP